MITKELVHQKITISKSRASSLDEAKDNEIATTE
jgi:hypothetical protein